MKEKEVSIRVFKRFIVSVGEFRFNNIAVSSCKRVAHRSRLWTTWAEHFLWPSVESHFIVGNKKKRHGQHGEMPRWKALERRNVLNYLIIITKVDTSSSWRIAGNQVDEPWGRARKKICFNDLLSCEKNEIRYVSLWAAQLTNNGLRCGIPALSRGAT